jgi:Zn-dependent protease
VAFVNPPMRPGAMLWSIAAGPLVNVALVPVIWATILAYSAVPVGRQLPDVQQFLHALQVVNMALLVFNVLPIYPLDGGQILQSILWFFVGFARSLQAVSVIGLVVGIVGGGLMFLIHDYWMVVMAIFVIWQAWRGFQLARMVLRAQKERAQAIAAAHAAPEPWNQAS